MKEYIVTGTARFSNVEFYVTADSEADAIAKVNKGEHETRDLTFAECVDWEGKNAKVNK